MTVVFGGAEYPAYIIDGQTLREEPLDAQEMRQWCQETPQDPNAVAFWRMLGELDTALQAGLDRLDDREPGTPRWAAAAVRLAHVHHWRGEYAEAHELFAASQEVFSRSGPDGGPDEQMLAFVHQHRAKTLFDQGRLDEALADARAALALRERLLPAGDAVVLSTRQTLARIERAAEDA